MINCRLKNNKTLILIINIILVLLWMYIVFYFSNEVAVDSDETSSNFILPIVKFFRPDLTGSELDITVSSLQFIVRKLAHFTLYTLGGIFLYNLYKSFDVFDKWKSRLFAFMTGFLYATSDEIHQFFVEGRSCELRDLCIDTLGIVVGICVANFIIYILKNGGKTKWKHI